MQSLLMWCVFYMKLFNEIRCFLCEVLSCGEVFLV